MDSDLSDKIQLNSNAGEVKTLALKKGMVSLREVGVQKVKEGLTTVEEIYRETVL